MKSSKILLNFVKIHKIYENFKKNQKNQKNVKKITKNFDHNFDQNFGQKSGPEIDQKFDQKFPENLVKIDQNPKNLKLPKFDQFSHQLFIQMPLCIKGKSVPDQPHKSSIRSVIIRGSKPGSLYGSSMGPLWLPTEFGPRRPPEFGGSDPLFLILKPRKSDKNPENASADKGK